MDYKYDKRTRDFEVIASAQCDDMRLTVTCITESDMMYDRTYYNVCMVYGALRVFDSVESNLERLWHIYDTIRIPILYGR
jgi:hypothetical protein